MRAVSPTAADVCNTSEDEEIVPLGVLLSERVEKFEASGWIPTSATWTGQADSQTPDSDA